MIQNNDYTSIYRPNSDYKVDFKCLFKEPKHGISQKNWRNISKLGIYFGSSKFEDPRRVFREGCSLCKIRLTLSGDTFTKYDNIGINMQIISG